MATYTEIRTVSAMLDPASAAPRGPGHRDGRQTHPAAAFDTLREGPVEFCRPGTGSLRPSRERGDQTTVPASGGADPLMP
jgi:hypothetical protein